MIEIVLGLLSVGMVTCYVTSAVYCALNLWYNKSVIDPMIRKAFYLSFVATFFIVIFMHNKIERPQLEGRDNWRQIYD